MEDYAIILFEPGMPECIPGINRNIPSLVFPFWGDYTFLDFHLSNFTALPGKKVYLIFLEKQKAIALKLSTLIKKDIAEIVILENGIYSLISKLKELSVEKLFFSFLSYISLFDINFFSGSNLLKTDEALKFSIENVPLEFYLLKHEIILNKLNSNLNQNTEKMDIIEFIFNNILHSSFDRIVDIPGKLLFHNNLLQLYQNNQWLINNQLSKEFLKLLSFSSVINQNIQNSYIGMNGYIKNSFLGTGVEIHGMIENSIIFSNVIVRENTLIKNSVIMNNNRIGKNCTIQNTIIFPYFDEMQNNYYNINDNVMIGGKLSSIKNNIYPDQIYNGISMIGTNANIPKNFIIETGCCLGSDKSEKELRKLEKLKKGTCLL